MSNHPNRSGSGPSPCRNPAPDEIRVARMAAGLTQTEAAAHLCTTDRVWRQWEAGDRRMHPAFWALFRQSISESAAHDGRLG